MIKQILSAVCMAVSIFLMALPNGLEMHFMADPDGDILYHIVHVSHFSHLPLGYGNWFPTVTAWLSVTVLVILIVRIINRNNNTSRILLILLVICAISLPLSWLLFIRGGYGITLIGIFISFLNIVTLALQIKLKRLGAV